MMVSLISGTALAVDESAGEGEQLTTNGTLTVQGTPLYVASNPGAGLDGRVNVSSDLLGNSGTLFLPGKAAADKLCFSWDDASVTLEKDGVAYISGSAPVAAENESVTYQVKKGAAVSSLTVKTLKGSSGGASRDAATPPGQPGDLRKNPTTSPFMKTPVFRIPRKWSS